MFIVSYAISRVVCSNFQGFLLGFSDLVGVLIKMSRSCKFLESRVFVGFSRAWVCDFLVIFVFFFFKWALLKYLLGMFFLF